ncbi:Mov34/MPN/PAD-1 family protein [Xanthomonas campestris]|uniref:Mov34/MPN/PAD-1 family protein n=1 Tax=Xanthomonas campestris TaxID=339 RepID=UPI003CE565B6
MNIIISPEMCGLLSKELKLAGSREIGGVLVGEHLGAGRFQVADVSVQRHGGSRTYFKRDPEIHRAFISEFYRRTGCDYARFNYLGEWHSHPSCPAIPSAHDLYSMQSIVEQPEVNVDFALLLVVRQRFWRGLEASATVFRPTTPPIPILLEQPGDYRGRRCLRQLL